MSFSLAERSHCSDTTNRTGTTAATAEAYGGTFRENAFGSAKKANCVFDFFWSWYLEEDSRRENCDKHEGSRQVYPYDDSNTIDELSECSSQTEATDFADEKIRERPNTRPFRSAGEKREFMAFQKWKLTRDRSQFSSESVDGSDDLSILAIDSSITSASKTSNTLKSKTKPPTHLYIDRRRRGRSCTPRETSVAMDLYRSHRTLNVSPIGTPDKEAAPTQQNIEMRDLPPRFPYDKYQPASTGNISPTLKKKTISPSSISVVKSFKRNCYRVDDTASLTVNIGHLQVAEDVEQRLEEDIIIDKIGNEAPATSKASMNTEHLQAATSLSQRTPEIKVIAKKFLLGSFCSFRARKRFDTPVFHRAASFDGVLGSVDHKVEERPVIIPTPGKVRGQSPDPEVEKLSVRDDEVCDMAAASVEAIPNDTADGNSPDDAEKYDFPDESIKNKRDAKVKKPHNKPSSGQCLSNLRTMSFSEDHFHWNHPVGGIIFYDSPSVNHLDRSCSSARISHWSRTTASKLPPSAASYDCQRVIDPTKSTRPSESRVPRKEAHGIYQRGSVHAIKMTDSNSAASINKRTLSRKSRKCFGRQANSVC